MAKPDEPESLAWGTLEELLLACAIHRHGTESWDSVAREVQKRSSPASHSFTSLDCKRKYHDLKRCFDSQTDLAGGAGGGDTTIPWLQELRRRRIAELKRDLQRYDLSIGSLQLKLKRLSEELAKSLTENERKDSDLKRNEKRERGDDREEEEGNKNKTPSPTMPDAGADNRAPAVESDRENHSVNASDSSDPKADKSGSGEKAGEKKHAVDSPADLEEETAKPAAGEDSYNGSSDTIAVEKGSAKTEPVCDSPVLVESVAESKRGEEEERLETETSEVQSSASLSGKKGRRKSRCLKNAGEVAENQCAAEKCASVKPQPLADLLDVIRHHKFGSVFERRLDSQESSKYKSMIRQHVDLASIRKRLEEGVYSECHSEFYRDLLLLATNATLFFPKRAPEHKSAIELRRLVSSRLPRRPTKVKLECRSADSPPLLTGPVVACRKRGSIVSKSSSADKSTSASSEGKDKKPSWLGTVTKKRTRDQSSSAPRTQQEDSEAMKKSVADFLNRIRRSSTDPSNDGGSGGKSQEKGKKKGPNGEASKTVVVGRPPKRAAAVAGTRKRRSDGGGDKADDALPKKRSRK